MHLEAVGGLALKWKKSGSEAAALQKAHTFEIECQPRRYKTPLGECKR
jgi:hypothetical protein